MPRTRSTLLALVLVLGALAAAVPWLRARDESDPGLRLVLNLPAYRLDVYESGERTRSYMVAVGQPRHQTPVGEYRIERAVWNPWWHPPKSGWAQNREPEPPGPANPMGRVKLHFHELYYVHGTHDSNPLGLPESHGCVRMKNHDVIELARLVHRYGSPGVSRETLDGLADSPDRTRTLRMERPIPLEVKYELVEVADGRVHVYRDFYGRAAKDLRERIVGALARAGVDPSSLDDRRVDELAALARRQPAIVPIENLLAAPAFADERDTDAAGAD